MKLLCVINPVSGDKDKRYFINNINNYCYTYGVEHKIYMTTGAGDLASLVALIDDFKPDRVISAGGDGTFTLVVDALIGRGIPVGYIPFGSANGMKGDIFISDSPWEAFEILMNTYHTRPLDIIRINDKPCVHVSDVGMNAQLVKNYALSKSRGMMAYARFFIGALRAQECYEFVIEANGQTFRRKGSMLAIANGTRYGTGIAFNPVGNPFDGQFEIIVIRNINFMTILRAGWMANYREMIQDDENFFALSTTEAKIGISRVTTLQIDGEIGGRFDHLDISMYQGKVPVLLPRKIPEILPEELF